jgi:cytochrome c oxidase assembly protein subunit 15
VLPEAGQGIAFHMEDCLNQRPNQGVHRFALFTTGCTFLLLTAGALVTSNDAGLSVPDWPLSYGSFLPPMVGGIRLEHGHRMIAAFVGVLTIILAIWLWRSDPRRWVRWLGVGALGLIVAQAVLGGITVRFYLPPPISMAHATLAQLFFAAVLSLSIFTSDWWRSDLPPVEDTLSPSLRSLAVLTSISILLQIALGAGFRHNALGIIPHLIGACVVTVMVVWVGRAIRKRFPSVRPLRKSAIWLHSFYGMQMLLGGAAYWAVRAARDAPQPMPLTVWITVAHVLFGALTLASSVVLTLCCFRLLKPGRALAIESPAQRAMI